MSKHNLLRTTIRNESAIAPSVERSLQTCKLRENEALLRRYIEKWTDVKRKNNLKSLVYILNMLLAEVPRADGRSYTRSFIEFNAAYEVYLSHSEYATSKQLDIVKSDKNIKKQFRDLILHPSYGLCVYIVTRGGIDYIILRPDDFDLDDAFSVLVKKEDQANSLNKKMITELLSSMDTEWDKNVLRYVLAKLCTYREFESLGMDAARISKNRTEIESVIQEITNLQTE